MSSYYLTQFSLTWEPQSVSMETVAQILFDSDNMSAYSDGLWFVNKLRHGGLVTRWSLHEEDMLALSESLPGVLFRLAGSGERPADVWVKFFLSGEMETHSMPAWDPPHTPHRLRQTDEDREKVSREAALKELMTFSEDLGLLGVEIKTNTEKEN